MTMPEQSTSRDELAASVDFLFCAIESFKDPRSVIVRRAPTFSALPEGTQGFWLVVDDETKGGGTRLYLFSGGRRYWVAEVEDV